MKKPLFSLLFTLITLGVFAQSQAEHFSFSQFKNGSTQNTPVVDITVSLERVGYGYPYVLGLIKNFQIDGYYFNNKLYQGNDLQAYGITFPMQGDNDMAKIQFSVSIYFPDINQAVVKNNLQMNDLDNLTNSQLEVPFDETTKKQMDVSGEKVGLQGGNNYWEQKGKFFNVTLLSVSSISFSKIVDAIKQLQSNGKKDQLTAKINTEFQYYTDYESFHSTDFYQQGLQKVNDLLANPDYSDVQPLLAKKKAAIQQALAKAAKKEPTTTAKSSNSSDFWNQSASEHTQTNTGTQPATNPQSYNTVSNSSGVNSTMPSSGNPDYKALGLEKLNSGDYQGAIVEFQRAQANGEQVNQYIGIAQARQQIAIADEKEKRMNEAGAEAANLSSQGQYAKAGGVIAAQMAQNHMKGAGWAIGIGTALQVGSFLLRDHNNAKNAERAREQAIREDNERRAEMLKEQEQRKQQELQKEKNLCSNFLNNIKGNKYSLTSKNKMNYFFFVNKTADSISNIRFGTFELNTNSQNELPYKTDVIHDIKLKSGVKISLSNTFIYGPYPTAAERNEKMSDMKNLAKLSYAPVGSDIQYSYVNSQNLASTANTNFWGNKIKGKTKTGAKKKKKKSDGFWK